MAMRYFKALIFFVLLAFLLVAIVYRFVWPITPPWLDAVVYGGAAVALVVGLSNRSGKDKDDETSK